MKKFLEGAVPSLFNFLFFFTPLILFPKTSELFELNKIVFIYLITTLIVFLWAAKMVVSRKIIFRRTILDIPLLIFVVSQFFSFLVSIDRHTSLLGYYGRFNGGVLSTLTYSLLYWAYVANMDAKGAKKSIYFLFASAFLVTVYAVLQHFGVDRDIWVQDVQSRVFSTLGQPNWLATFLIALIPLTWAFSLKTKRLVWWGLSIIFFIVLLYTKSRSGLLGFLAADIIFWVGVFKKSVFKTFVICNLTFVILALASGTPWTPSLENILTKSLPKQEEASSEPGGTESGEIRKIIWKGAIEVWKHYPLFGSGVETFAYSFYEFRPKEHNLVSEWDFLFNKAHNEYLNVAATTGTIGLLAYLILIGFSLYQILKKSKNQNIQNSNLKNNYALTTMRYALLSGYAGILVANFFGFATTTTSILFFLFPAMAVGLGLDGKRVKEQEVSKISLGKLISISVLSLFTISLFYLIIKYWYSDFLLAKGRRLGDEENFEEAREILSYAMTLSPKEPVILTELAQILSFEALTFEEKEDKTNAKNLAMESISSSQKALELSPRNLLFLRTRASILVRLSSLDPTYMHEAKNTMLLEAKYSPTDAKLFYNLGLAYARIGQTADAIATLERTIVLKENYRDARFALALVYISQDRKDEAIRELTYILAHINPDDALAQQELHELTGK